MSWMDPVVSKPGDDPDAALRDIAEQLLARGDLCGNACVEAAAEELNTLRTEALRNRVRLGERAIAALQDLNERDEYACPDCFGLRAHVYDKDKAAGTLRANESRGCWPWCSLAAILEAARFGQ